MIDYKSGSTSLEAYSYDALGRRIKQGSTAFYYSADWQVLEERDSGGVARVSMVWSPVYIDAMITRDRDSDTNGSLEERLYVAHDANFNVSSIIGTNGRALERFILDPYGSPTFLDGSWSTLGGSAYAWTHLHQGGRQSAASSLYHFRHRDLSPSLGRWVTACCLIAQTTPTSSGRTWMLYKSSAPPLWAVIGGVFAIFGTCKLAYSVATWIEARALCKKFVPLFVKYEKQCADEIASDFTVCDRLYNDCSGPIQDVITPVRFCELCCTVHKAIAEGHGKWFGRGFALCAQAVLGAPISELKRLLPPLPIDP